MVQQSSESPGLKLEVDGMSCASCVKRVEDTLASVAGVTEASVNLASETALVNGTAAAPELAAALHSAGYPARTVTVRLQVREMTCASCVSRVEKVLARAPGVLQASVNLVDETADVTYFRGATGPAELAAIATAAGYAAQVTSHEQSDRDDNKAAEASSLARRTWLALILTMPVFILEMGAHLIPSWEQVIARNIGTTNSWLIQFALTTLVMVWPGQVFLRKGIPALFKGMPDMNSLVAIGTLAAWSFSCVALFWPDLLPAASRAVYFEAAAVIITLILLGRYLESRAKGRTGEAIRKLIGLQPKTARIERNGETTDLAVEQIVIGDIVQVRPGERIAVDGTVIDGSSYVDESMLSGEPAPAQKQTGAELTGGTINGTGTLRFEATRVGADTTLAQIVRMVEQAQGARLPIQDVVNQVTAWFVPAVLAIAALTLGLWLWLGPQPVLSNALIACVSVLIIACPCAMGLATPTSIMVGTGRAAELGVLFRKGSALQTLQEATLVAVDKTGTLTAGQPTLTDLHVSEPGSEDEVLSLVAAVEAKSEHPIAHALVRAAGERRLELPPITDFESITGYGIRAIVSGQQVLVGADRFMTRNGIDLDTLQERAEQLASAGRTPLYAAVGGDLVAVIGIADPIKPGSREAISALHEMGLKITMITGDNSATANHIAAQLGIDQVVAEVLPEGKVDTVNELRSGGEKLAFVGDGINDAPALASADIGIAIGTGTDIAIESADVVLRSGDLRGVANAFEISRKTMRNISQNLFWAFGYNALLIPVAAGALYPFNGTVLSPMLAAGAMALSSVCVVSNALRLRRVKAHLEEPGQSSTQPG